MAEQRGQMERQGILALDCPLYGDVHGDRCLMDFPFFALEKTSQANVIKHQIGDVTITIRAGGNGIATMYDKEIILYVASLIFEQKTNGRDYSQEVVFTAYDFFRATSTHSPSKRDYGRFNDAMARLQGTQIMTNLETGGTGHRGWFSWLENAEVIYERSTTGKDKGVEKLRAVKVRLCDFLFRAIDRDASMYRYHHEYFKLGVLERRLYEIARSNCHDGSEYRIDLAQLHATVGSRLSRLRRFKEQLVKIESEDSLPHYRIEVGDDLSPGRTRARADEAFVKFSMRPRPPFSPYQSTMLKMLENAQELIED